MQTILILKTGALGDVLRTTSILAGLRELHPEARLEWVTAPAAAHLVLAQPEVAQTHRVDPADQPAIETLGEALSGTSWDWVISLDDEPGLCAMATRLGTRRLSGAFLDSQGERVYSPDVGPWFDMGLLSVHGKERADRLKVENRRSHPEIYAEMLGIPMGHPELPLPEEELVRASALFEGCRGKGPIIGLNTGAGGRWTSKQLPLERVLELVPALSRAFHGEASFVVLGGPEEAERNQRLLEGLSSRLPGTRLVDPGVNNSLLEFAAVVDQLDLLITSDSLALHIGVARRVPIVAFFAPTSAAEIELYGRGEKVLSTSPDYCSYRPDADNSTITVGRLVDAAERALSASARD